MKFLIFSITLFFSFDLLAAVDSGWSFGGFFSVISSFIDDIAHFIFVYIPDQAGKLKTWLIYYTIYLYINLKIEALQLAFSLAELLLSDLGLVSLMNSLSSSLPQDVKAFAVQVNFFKGINIVIEAAVARFIYDLLGGF